MALDWVRDFTVIGVVVVLLVALALVTRPTPSIPPAGFLIATLPEQPPQELSGEVLELVERINARNQLIRSFSCDRVKIILKQKQWVNVNGQIRYEKDRRFRMFVRSIGGREMDIGSNDGHFWFWSRRMTPAALYYSSYDNLYHNRLKTPFHPVWLKGILGFDPVSVKGVVARRRGPYWEIVEKATNMQRRPILRITLIDPAKVAIIGHYIYEEGRMVCSAEVYEHKLLANGEVAVPAKIVMRWYEEDVTMIWQLYNQRLNTTSDPRLWQMPNISPKVDIGQSSLSEL
jgi:hypothetical protein